MLKITFKDFFFIKIKRETQTTHFCDLKDIKGKRKLLGKELNEEKESKRVSLLFYFVSKRETL